LFAPILLTFVFMYGVPHLVPVLGQIKKGLPAEVAGLKPGDLVLSIDGKEIRSWDDLSSSVRRSAGAQLRIEIERGADNSRTRSVVLIKPAYEADKTAFGGTVHQWVIGVLPRGDLATTRTGPISAVGYALAQTADMTVMLVSGVAKIVTGATPVREALGGPIMIAQMAGQQAHEGFANLAFFTVMLSLELGIINLLPVPMLDGGHLAFFLIEGVRGKPLKVRHREIAQQVGLILLAGLMAFVIFNDISRIVQG
jgi:regulator of sigma E protease